MGGSGPEGDDRVVQHALRDQALHKVLLDQLDKGVCIVNDECRILYWNRAAERISGTSAREVEGQTKYGDLLLHCDDPAPLGDPAEQTTDLAEAPQPDETLALLLSCEGYRILVGVQSQPIRDGDGVIVGTVETFQEFRASAHGIREFDALSNTASPARAVHRKYGEMRARHALEALHAFEIPFGWLRLALDGAEDLDHRYGRGMVDAALNMVVAACHRNLGVLDVLSLWDGIELRVQINRCSHTELAAEAERLCLLVRTSCLGWWGDRLPMTVSVGGTTADLGDSLESLDARAGKVFDGCRASGGNRAAVAQINRSGA